MRKLFAVAAFLLASTAAQAQYTFEYGGHIIRIDPDRGTVSIPGVYDNTVRRTKRSRNDQDSDRPRKQTPQEAKTGPQTPNAAPAPSERVPAAANSLPEPSTSTARVAPEPSTATARIAPEPSVATPHVAPEPSTATPRVAPEPSATTARVAPSADTITSTQPPASAAPASQVQQDAAPATRPAPAPVVATAPASTPIQSQQDPPPATTATQSGSSPLGMWLTEEKEGKVRIEQCGGYLCGYSVDAKSNQNGEKVLINMKPGKDSKWSGRIFDPNTGSTYDSTIALKGSDNLRVQGCAFGGLFCGGQTWSRLN
jgi:uncharacterized protein (DUF2147 family)